MVIRRPRATGEPEESAERRSSRWLNLWCSALMGPDVQPCQQTASLVLLTGLSLADDAAVAVSAADALPGAFTCRHHDATLRPRPPVVVGVGRVPVGEGQRGAVQPGRCLAWKRCGGQEQFIIRRLLYYLHDGG